MRVVFPVDLGPNRKKDFFSINLDSWRVLLNSVVMVLFLANILKLRFRFSILTRKGVQIQGSFHGFICGYDPDRHKLERAHPFPKRAPWKKP